MARSPLPSIPTRLTDVEVVGAARRGVAFAAVVPSGADTEYTEVMDRLRATGKAAEVSLLPGPDGPRWLVGVGDGTARDYRAAGAAFVRAAAADAGESGDAAGRRGSITVQVELPSRAGPDHYGQFATGVLLGGYRYRVSMQDGAAGVRKVRLVAPTVDATQPYADAVSRACELARATALARDLANTPSNVKSPAWLANTAQRLTADLPGLTVTVRDERWLTEHGFGGTLAVGGGSASPPRLIEALYRPRGATAHLLFVGKGITFDTGGISVKPAEGMHVMRTDMSGGGAVLAAMRAIAALRLKVRVTALVPAAENLISGSAYRPGDVVRHYGGRTTEVTNTDAEGRMVLADALAYGTSRFSPDLVVDVATLTGAMKIALGLRTGGLFSGDDDLAQRLRAAGERVGEAWWRMPLPDDHARDVRSDIADVRQVPPGPGGIVAALFLREFAGGLPWAHLDIAGPARSDKNYDEVVPGGTGFAARTLVELAASYA